MGGRQHTVPPLSIGVSYAFIDTPGSGHQTCQEASDVHCNQGLGMVDTWQHTLPVT